MDVIMTQSSMNSYLRKEMQNKIDQISNRIQSNGHGGDFSDSSRIDEIVKTERDLLKFDNRIEISKMQSTKIEEKINLIEPLKELMMQFKQSLNEVRSDTELGSGMFKSVCKNTLQQLQDMVNDVPSMGGSSDIYNDKCMDISLMNVPPSPLNADYSYAIGGDQGDLVHIDHTDGKWDLSSFTVQDPMIEEFVRSLRLAAEGDVTKSNDPYFAASMDHLDKALHYSDIALRSQGELKQAIDLKIDMMTNLSTKLQEFYEDIAVEKMAELVVMHSTMLDDIEALYQMFIRDIRSIQDMRSMNDRLFF